MMSQVNPAYAVIDAFTYPDVIKLSDIKYEEFHFLVLLFASPLHTYMPGCHSEMPMLFHIAISIVA